MITAKTNKKIKKTKSQLRLWLVFILSVVLLSGVLTFTTENAPKNLFTAVVGSLQGELSSSANDLFSCAGRDDCSDDADDTLSGPQHKYIAQSYDKFGFPLAGVKYKWTKDDKDDLLKFVEIPLMGTLSDESVISGTENDQEIFVQPNDKNLNNGQSTVSVLGYLNNDLAQGKTQTINVDLYYCLNTWPNTATFPFEDSGTVSGDPYSNFKTYYCKDRGNIVDPNDDYPALKVVERSIGSGDEFSCSGGGGNGLKCSNDYLISYSSAWDKFTLGSKTMPIVGGMPNISSPDTIGFDGKGANNTMLLTSGYSWVMWAGGWGSGNILSSTPFAVWPDGPKAGTPLKPTALGMNGNNIILIEGNFIKRSNTGGTNWLVGPTTLSEEGWPIDVQFPTEISLFSKTMAVGDEYLMAMKDDYYRIYSQTNQCNTSKKCQNSSNRTWGSCVVDKDCYWGEKFSLYETKEWPTTISKWTDNFKFPVKTLALDGTGGDVVLSSSSCERSKGTCLLKEFLLISNPACSDGLDNDNDGGCDWQDNLCGTLPKDSDCSDPSDNSESGTCNDGVDNDNDGDIDYPDDFSCSSYSDVEEDACAIACCDNVDNDSDGFADQKDSACTNKDDDDEVSACSDNVDNDSDGTIDMNDPGCADINDNSETGTIQCDDDKDNDSDSKTDFDTNASLTDPSCTGPSDDNESI